MHTEIARLDTIDGERLIGTWTAPDAPRAVVLVAGATAAPHRYYARFARFAAERGYGVLTFDYRGVGASRPDDLRRYPATLRAWAERDLPAALAFAERKAQGLPLLWLGHSFGGQALGLAPGAGRVDGALTVGAQLGWYGHWPAAQRPRLWAIWNLVIPTAVATAGYLPGWLGLGEDLPGGVAAEWARWCRSPNYLLDHVPGAAASFASFGPPVHVLGATDDAFAPVPAVQAFGALFPSATTELWAPGDHGLARIDHFGFFAREGASLWPLLVDRLDALGGARRRAVGA